MRLLALLGTWLALGSCGSGPPRPATHAQTPRPPPIVLETRAGNQIATQGSSCVNETDPSGGGVGICADTPYPAPTELNVVRPGESVRVAVAGAGRIEIDVHRLGCEQQSLRRIALRAGELWRLDLAPGLYDLQVFVAHFSVGDLSGDSTGGLGVWVDRAHRLEIVPAKSVHPGACR